MANIAAVTISGDTYTPVSVDQSSGYVAVYRQLDANTPPAQQARLTIKVSETRSGVRMVRVLHEKPITATGTTGVKSIVRTITSECIYKVHPDSTATELSASVAAVGAIAGLEVVTGVVATDVRPS